MKDLFIAALKHAAPFIPTIIFVLLALNVAAMGVRFARRGRDN